MFVDAVAARLLAEVVERPVVAFVAAVLAVDAVVERVVVEPVAAPVVVAAVVEQRYSSSNLEPPLDPAPMPGQLDLAEPSAVHLTRHGAADVPEGQAPSYTRSYVLKLIPSVNINREEARGTDLPALYVVGYILHPLACRIRNP